MKTTVKVMLELEVEGAHNAEEVKEAVSATLTEFRLSGMAIATLGDSVETLDDVVISSWRWGAPKTESDLSDSLHAVLELAQQSAASDDEWAAIATVEAVVNEQ
jgi:hypothetical protein